MMAATPQRQATTMVYVTLLQSVLLWEEPLLAAVRVGSEYAALSVEAVRGPHQ